ncbi:DNA methyltransferase [Exiguobacterium sp. MMG028]|nr:DNA methyltransferase [Exiguobacterium sp. MMG028]MDA5561783.1 DNA methyltransferase [Exiguobacterium sp. MMG028]
MMSEHEQLSFTTGNETNGEPVVCLGLTFKNDDERRVYFREELRKKLPELKQIDGFPIGQDEDIIALSDPPYYTACPNPWLNEFIQEWELQKQEYYKEFSNDIYKVEPFTSDVSEGKNDAVYNAHSYHTKVPPKAILNYLLHYTNPGDIVYDGFSGTGMTGVASIMANQEVTVEQLKQKSLLNHSKEISYGNRNVILGDLSPIATFISKNYNTPLNSEDFEKEALKIIFELEDEYGWMYQTLDENTQKHHTISYTVWSDVFSCPQCESDIVFHYDATDDKNNKVLDSFSCPNCKINLTKKELNRSWEYIFDEALNQNVKCIKTLPVMICYKENNRNKLKTISQTDNEIIDRINNLPLDSWYPTDRMPEGDESRRNDRIGYTHVQHFYTKRNLFLLSKLHERISVSPYRDQLLLLFTSHLVNLSKLNRYRPEVSFPYNPLSGTLYIGSRVAESNIFEAYKNKVKKLKLAFLAKNKNNVVSLHSQSHTNIKDNTIDYVFTDPPFGANIMYSELSFLWESWIRVKTNNKPEAIINKSQNKKINSYQKLMEQSFKEYYRVLKPGRWITVEFSNSKASIWNSIQDSIQKAGFIIANVAALDKKMGSFKAVTSATAVKQDLVISAYKPLNKDIKNIQQKSNSIESAWMFTSQHLEKLPLIHKNSLQNDYIIERTPRILFDRMVAYHIQNNLPVPISSAEYQKELTQRFPLRDGMIFLDNQVTQYDKYSASFKEVSQTSLFISEESSAIEWIRQQLLKTPQTRQDLHPKFMKEIQHIAKHEKLPELDELLVQNFLRYDSEPEVPSQIVSYFRRNYPDLRGLEPTDEKIKQKAMNRWYVPDPNKQADLEKLREKSLLREFNLYVDEMTKSKKKLKEFRTEAIRAGFKKAWSEKDYQTIVDIGNRLPETVIQEDDKLLMYFDNAQIKLGL